MKKDDIYSLITNRIIEKLNQGVIPWQQGYTSLAPQNFITRKPYSGINYFITIANGFKSPFYLSFKQVKDLGGNVKAGEKATPIVFWQILEKSVVNADGQLKKQTIPLLKYYNVFNAEQVSGIEFPEEVNKVGEIDVLDEVLKNMQDIPRITEGTNYHPCYVPAMDIIKMPLKNSYHSAERYYKTLFHELGHATGATKRINRLGISKFDNFGSEQYSQEELIAEMTASFAMSFAGLENETIDNSAAYIQSWIKVLQNDSKFIFCAAKQAEKAWKYIRNEIGAENANLKAA